MTVCGTESQRKTPKACFILVKCVCGCGKAKVKAPLGMINCEVTGR